ncbi:pentapeptide repeat-containing protein [Streptomyces erythrochromogenes]|uniref:pentapeptide repeat-containing protein n=1 Tax=Streptomyces erythrochromogenes TaxID=285574 RepID=UPI0038190E24
MCFSAARFSHARLSAARLSDASLPNAWLPNAWLSKCLALGCPAARLPCSSAGRAHARRDPHTPVCGSRPGRRVTSRRGSPSGRTRGPWRPSGCARSPGCAG